MRISDWSSDVCSSDVEGAEVIATLGERILGRSASIDIKHPLSGEVLMKAGELIEERDVDRIETAGVESALIRSVLTCDSEVGVCGKRSEEHTSELQSLMRISYAVFCLKKKTH